MQELVRAYMQCQGLEGTVIEMSKCTNYSNIIQPLSKYLIVPPSSLQASESPAVLLRLDRPLLDNCDPYDVQVVGVLDLLRLRFFPFFLPVTPSTTSIGIALTNS